MFPATRAALRRVGARVATRPPAAVDRARPPHVRCFSDARDGPPDEAEAARLPTPKEDSDLSKKAPPLSDEQKKKLTEQWADYVDYMGHQRDKGWKT